MWGGPVPTPITMTIHSLCASVPLCLCVNVALSVLSALACSCTVQCQL
jgi:hypothetical protein